MTSKITRAAFLTGMLPGLKKLAAAGPGGGSFLGVAGNGRGGCVGRRHKMLCGWPGLWGGLAKGGVTEVA